MSFPDCSLNSVETALIKAVFIDRSHKFETTIDQGAIVRRHFIVGHQLKAIFDHGFIDIFKSPETTEWIFGFKSTIKLFIAARSEFAFIVERSVDDDLAIFFQAMSQKLHQCLALFPVHNMKSVRSEDDVVGQFRKVVVTDL